MLQILHFITCFNPLILEGRGRFIKSVIIVIIESLERELRDSVIKCKYAV